MATKPSTSVPKSKKSITLEKEIETKVRRIQARLIEKTDQNWSLSTVLNILVTGGLLQTKKMSKNDWQKIRDLVERKAINFDESTMMDFVKKIVG
ncbi:MAG TPA: hypothetical protein VD828_04360 [Candidatus Nitrosotenuis sp.]|jgi:hypothetical protein|nr:hypothetical protein [Candidatus Nitrosotenuis sp.]